MKKYSVSIPYYCSHIVEVMASNEEEALELAHNQGPPSICHQCSDEIEIHDSNDSAEPDVIELEAKERK